MSADRNLLLGILAFQNNFIDRQALLAAFDDWTGDKAKPLGQILVNRGALAADSRALLEALVEKHIELHGGDAEQSLAAVSTLGSARRELERIADPELQASLARAASAATGVTATLTLPAGGAFHADSRFTILRPHAKGGLGEVFVAHDHELHRQVALKQIQARHAHDADSRGRFIVEAEITGGLEHPGIVPVYGLGQYADGRPYYAMRFIRGDDLRDAIERFHARPKHEEGVQRRESSHRADRSRQPLSPSSYASVELRKLLGRFLDVCNAVEYAHSRGILHRDLKPGNIMLGKHGETLVVDWGLAKPVGRPEGAPDRGEDSLRPVSAGGSARTQMGSAVGTPEYMSPEQAGGRLDRLGPASDVYSLGATLYCLLTGEAPFRRGRHEKERLGELLGRVERGEFRPPRELRPEVPRGLEAICLKAMAREPGDRYASAAALADDIEHWLADEPLAARRDPLLERLARWSRRRRTLTRVAAAVVVTVAIGGMVALLLVNEQKDIAQQERDHAQRQEALTEQNFQHAVAAADAMVERIAAGLKPLAGAKTETVEAVLDSARDIYDRLAVQAGDRQELRAGRAQMLNRFSEVYFDLGNTTSALASAKQARSMYESLLATRPDDDVWQAGLATSHERAGIAAGAQGMSKQGIAEFRRCVAIRRRLAAARPNDAERRRDLAVALNRVAHGLDTQGDLEGRDAAHDEALSLRQRLLDEAPDDPQRQRDLAVSRQFSGGILWERERLQDSVAAYGDAVQTLRGLAADHPQRVDWQNDLADAAIDYGSAAKASEDCPSAQAAFALALDVAERLLSQDPRNIDIRRRQLRARFQLGDLVTQTESLDLARLIATFRDKLAISREMSEAARELSRRDPHNAQPLADVASIARQTSQLLLSLAQLGDATPTELGEAESLSRQAVRDAEQLVQRDRDNVHWQRSLALAHRALGEVMGFKDQPLERLHEELAMDEGQQALASRLLERYPNVNRWRGDWARALYSSAMRRLNLARLGETPGQNLKKARTSAEQAIELLAKLVDQHPDNQQWLTDRATALGVLGQILIQQDQGPEGEALLDQSRALYKAVAQQNPPAPASVERFGCSAGIMAMRVANARMRAAQARDLLSLLEQSYRLTQNPERPLEIVDACLSLSQRLGEAPTEDHVCEARLALARAAKVLASLASASDVSREVVADRTQRLDAAESQLPPVVPLCDDAESQAALARQDHVALASRFAVKGKFDELARLFSRQLACVDHDWPVQSFVDLAEEPALAAQLIAAARRLLAEEPRALSAGGRRMSAFLAAAIGETDAAVEFYRSLVDDHPLAVDLYEALVRVLVQAWRWRQAEAATRQLIEGVAARHDVGQTTEHRMLLAELQLGLYDFESAQETLAWLVEHVPHDSRLSLYQARLFAIQRRLDDARGALLRILDAPELDASAHESARLALAGVCEELGQPDAAEEALRLLGEGASLNSRAFLAYLRLSHGANPSDVAPVIDAAWQGQSTNPVYRWFHAVLVWKQGDSAAGLAELEPLANHELLGNWPEVLDDLGEMRMAAGRSVDASNAWRSAIDKLPPDTPPDDWRKCRLLQKLQSEPSAD